MNQTALHYGVLANSPDTVNILIKVSSNNAVTSSPGFTGAGYRRAKSESKVHIKFT